MDTELLLADLVRKLRGEIASLHRESQQTENQLLWKLTDCEIEVNFVAREARNIDGKMSAAIFATSATRAYSSEQVHKIKLKMTPVLKGRALPDDETIQEHVLLSRQPD